MIGKKHRYILALLLVSAHHSHDAVASPSDESIDLEQFDTNVLNRTIKRKYTPCDALSLLFNLVHANEILKNDFYLYTFPFVNRDIVTYPSLTQWAPERTHVGFNVFVQTTYNAFPFSNGVQGYLNVFGTSLLRSINLSIAQANGICIPSLISLLQNARVQQWRVGFILDAYKRFEKWGIGIQLPLYAIAKHYNLPLEDQHELRSLDIFGQGENVEVKESALYPYAVETRLGFGDIRFNLAYDVYQTDWLRMSVGGIAQLPSSTTFTSDLIGSDFQKIATRGSLNLGDIIEKIANGTTEQKCEAKNTCIAFGKQFAYYLGAILLPTDLGQDDRCTLGIYAQPVIRPEEKVSILTCGKLNWLLPKKINRYIKETVNQARFSDSNFNPAGHTEEFCHAALDTLDTRLTNMLFPASYCATLESQLEAQFTAASKFQCTDAWSFLIGYDYWCRSVESCKTICVTDVAFPTDGLQLCTALRPRASQHTLFLQGSYLRLGMKHDLAITLGLDWCMVGKGIGQDLTGVVTFQWKF